MNLKDGTLAKMPRHFTTLAVLLIAGLLSAFTVGVATASPHNLFTPSSFSGCDGTGWDGLVFGKSTAGSVKADFQINQRNNVDLSLRLAAPRSAGVVARALFAGKADSAPLTGIMIDYDPGKPYLDAIQQDIGDPGISYYSETRFEDWWIQVFPTKGIVAYVVNTGAPQVQSIMVCPPNALTRALVGFTTDKPDISRWATATAEQTKTMLFGSVNATASTLGMDIPEDTCHAIESDMKSDTDGGAIRYWAGGSGAYTVRLSGSYSAINGGTIAADAKLVGDGPNGTTTGEGTGFADIPANSSDFSRYARDAANDARRIAQQRFTEYVKLANPPSLDTYRTRSWRDLVDRLRFESDSSVVNPKAQ